MLNFAIDYRMAIDSMTSIQDLWEYKLDNDEQATAINLRNTLKVQLPQLLLYTLVKSFCQILKHATLFFSHSMPNLSTVIPAMDHIDAHLATASSQHSTYSISICATLTTGKCTLNRYYDKTDQSEVYRIAMGICILLKCNLGTLLIISQFFIHVTSFSTSRMQDGTMPGSKQRTQLFMKNLIEHMHSWIH